MLLLKKHTSDDLYISCVKCVKLKVNIGHDGKTDFGMLIVTLFESRYTIIKLSKYVIHIRPKRQ